MRYQINIIESDADLEEIRKACADLLDPDQLNEAGEETNAVYIDTSTASISAVVQRINALGYSTDEDCEEWRTEVHQTEDEVVTWIKWGPCTPAWGKKYADLYCEYAFFDTEKEAAKDFLQELAKHPEARFPQDQYQLAREIVSQA